MDYEGLTRDDLLNVYALNRSWLEGQHANAQDGVRLTSKRLERLAGTPFLLFSFRWQQCRLLFLIFP